VRQVPPSPIQPTDDGRRLRLFGFPLREVPPGSYTMTIEVRDTATGATAMASERFSVLAARR
jgi:hypothetical protein